jgi:molybdate transport system regulatory protein
VEVKTSPKIGSGGFTVSDFIRNSVYDLNAKRVFDSRVILAGIRYVVKSNNVYDSDFRSNQFLFQVESSMSKPESPIKLEGLSKSRGKRWDHLELLERIDASGSISSAATAMGMSY